MATQDFLVTFSVNGNEAIRALEQIGRKVTDLEARLNALGRGRAGQINVGVNPASINRAMADIDRLHAKITSLQETRTINAQLGLPNTVAALQAEARAQQGLANAFQRQATAVGAANPLFSTYNSLAARAATQAQTLAQESRILANSLDESSQAFGRHARRIAEGILIYEAFGRAIQGIQSAVGLVVDIDRESRRLEAVLDISQNQSPEFIRQLGQIASDTVTPFENLVSEADRAAAAFLDMEDPLQRAAAAEELLRRSGQFTTVTQRDLGLEIQNVIGIMKQLNIPIDELGDFLGKIVVAGGDSSTVISGLADALEASSRAAFDAGVDLDTLLALESAFLIATGRAGSAVGNTFKTMFQRLADPDVINGVNEITGGLLRMRDALGNIRDPFDIMQELNALLDSGAINATQFKDVMDTIGPPLNPAAKADFILINQLLQEIGGRVSEIGKADVSSLDELVEKINDALGPQFQKLIIDAQVAFVGLFGDQIIEAGQDLIDVLRFLGSILGSIPAPVLTTIGSLAALLAIFKLLTFTGSGLMRLLGIDLAGSFVRLGGAATATGAATGAAGVAAAGSAAKFTLFGKTLFTAGGAVAGLARQLTILLPLVAAWMAFDFAQQLSTMESGLRGQVAELAEGADVSRLQELRNSLQSQLNELNTEFSLNPVDIVENIGKDFAANAVQQNIAELDRLIAQLEARGPGATVSMDELSGAFQDSAASADASREATEAVDNAYRESQEAAEEYARSLQNVSEEERIATEVAGLLAGLVDEQADALNNLNDRLKEGDITQAQWTEGQTQIQQASDLSAQLVAALGDSLRTLIPELGGAAAGNEALTGELFELIFAAGDALPVIAGNVDMILQLVAAEAAATAVTDQFGRTTNVFAGQLSSLSGILSIFPGLTANYTQGMLQALGATVGLDAGLKSLIASTQRNASLLNMFFPGLGDDHAQRQLEWISSQAGAGANVGGDISAAIAAAVAAIRNATVSAGNVITGQGIPSGTGAGAGARQPTQTPTLDIGDLPADQLTRLITIATRLRNQIPGERAQSMDDIVAIIKDAKFLQTVKGIDDRLLRIALERLTDIEEARLKLEEEKMRNEEIMRNLVTRVGPLGALISQPTAFGVGGSLAFGSGLNIDPNSGNFTINVPIELRGLEPRALQSIIYETIARAIRDARRVG